MTLTNPREKMPVADFHQLRNAAERSNYIKKYWFTVQDPKVLDYPTHGLWIHHSGS